ncbi:MAG: penicillin-binding protein 2 [Rhodospirillales bacterium]|nr:penicillin-binding protein 2 [Rhodospirillales bacterium]
MARREDHYPRFRRRTLLLGGLQAGLLGLLGGRLHQLQSVETDKYRVLAEGNRLRTRLLMPTRGLIFDRTGRVLAANRSNFRLLMTAEKPRASAGAKLVEMVLDRLGRLVTISERDRRHLMEQIRQPRGFVPLEVRENLTWDEMARIEFNVPDLPGVSIGLGQTREYFNADLTSHIVGYTGRVSAEDLASSDEEAVLELPDLRIGKRGIEKSADRALRGKPGVVQVEVNAVGRVMRQLNRAEGDSGADVVLTIDVELQQFVADRLGDQSAAAVVMDVITGDVLAMVSVPGFDSNVFARGITQAEWQRLLNDPRKPLVNKAAQGVYPPGSTYKIVTALAALESRALTLSDRIFCGGSIDLPGWDQKKYCWICPSGHGWLNVTEALQHSCDVFFYEAAKRAGVDQIVQAARKLGFGKRTDIGLAEESPGLLPTPGWTLERTGRPWTIGNTYNLGIGQGDMLATPLQIAVMTARVANGGYGVRPRLIAATVNARRPIGLRPLRSAPEAPGLSFRAENLNAIRNGMDLVVNSPSGTAFASRIMERDKAMAGKTGTSQVKRMTDAERDRKISQEQLPWHLRHHALFCAYAPVGNPRYACAVVVEHGIGGSRTAAPVARDILLQVQKIDPSRRTVRPSSLTKTVFDSTAETPATAGRGDRLTTERWQRRKITGP